MLRTTLFTGAPTHIAAATLDNAGQLPTVRVLERRQDFTAYETDEVERNERGEQVTRTRRFTLLENGLNYLENGQYVPSEDIVESFPEGAVARRGPVRAIFSSDLNVETGLAVDQISGRVGVSWYDCRNDPSNVLTHFFAAVSGNGFDSEQPGDFQLNPGASNSMNYDNTCGIGIEDCCYGSPQINYGDYTGLAFHGGFLYPAWSWYGTGTGTGRCGDIHVCRVVM